MKYSRRYTTIICSICKKERSVRMCNIKEKCRSCSNKDSGLKRGKIHRNILLNTPPKEFSPKFFLDLYLAASVFYQKNTKIVSIRPTAKFGNNESTYGILKKLGLKDFGLNYDIFKSELLKWFKKQSIQFKWEVANNLLIKSALKTNKTVWTIPAASKQKRDLLDSFPLMEFKHYTCGISKLVKGSFFKDNSWIHI